ncbi:unnamed protein product [Ectocarpus sp. 4 AP-2014]
MFVSPFTVSISCDAAIIVIYLQRSPEFGGTPWFVVEDGHGFATEAVDVVWLAMLRIAFLLPHVLGFLKRRRLSCPGFHHTFVVANMFFVVAKVIAVLVGGPDPNVALLWWLLLVLSAVSIVAQRGCLHHLRSSMPTPRYKTIFMGSRLDARLLDEQYDHDMDSDYDDDDDDYSSSEELGRGAGGVDSSMEAGVRGGGSGGGGSGGSEETKAYLGRVTGACRQSPAKKTERQRTQSRAAHPSARRRRRRRRNRSGSFRHRQESTRELVDYFADRMQEARAAWSARVSALQKRWQASFLSGDGWGVRGGGSPAADRDAALRLTFGLIVRLYAYEDTLEDLRLAAEQDPMCLEAFAPQLASFLVWDSYYMSGQMEAWLLARCSENLYFAHALEFQLRASCLPAAALAAATAIDGAPASDGGGGGGDFLSPGGKNLPALATSRRDSRNSGGSGCGGGSLAASTAEGGGAVAEDDDGGVGGGIDRVGRRAVELLLKEIAENGERAARRLVEEAAEAAAAAAVRPASLREGNGGDDSGGESSGRLARAPPAMTAVVAGSKDVAAPAGGAQARTEGGVGGGDGGDGKSEKQAPLLYRQTIDFLARLGDIASSLTPLSKAKRTSVLKEQLAEVGETFLGAVAAAGEGRSGDEGNSGERLVYVPVGDRHHRIVAVHPSESFAFSTRERAPCFVCLEVVGVKEPGLGRGRGRRRRREGDQGSLAEARGEGEDEEDERGGGGGRNKLSRRIQALRQWLPSGVSFQQLRFPGSSRGEGLGGGFKGWTLSLGTEGSDDVEPESVMGKEEEEEEGGGARASGAIRVRSEDIEQGGVGTTNNLGVGGGGGNDDESLPREKYRRRRGGGGGRGRPGDATADHYRLLVDEETGDTTSGPGVLPLSSMGNARDWWTASSTGTGRPWGGDDDDVGDDTLADVLERRLPTSKPLPEGYTSGGGSSGGADSTGGASRRGSEEEGESGDGGRGASSSGDGVPQPQVLFNELWHDKSNRIRRVSPWAEEPGWRLLPVIVKSNDDLRQEQLASQLLFVMQRILRAEGVGVWLRPYDIVALSADTGLVEAVPDTISLDALRRHRGSGREGAKETAAASEEGDASAAVASRFSLTGFFETRFGAKGSDGFREAQRRFIESLAAYSIACYLLQIKDRHNGNILLDSQGRVIHVDFGFMLANSPGGNLGFESAPFKLTQGFLNLMGGTQSRCFREFRGLCVDTFLALRRSSQEIVLLVEMMASGNENLPCFQGPGGGAAAAADLAARFQPELNDPACQDFVHKLVQQSAGSWTTAWYDKYQRFWSGIY